MRALMLLVGNRIECRSLSLLVCGLDLIREHSLPALVTTNNYLYKLSYLAAVY